MKLGRFYLDIRENFSRRAMLPRTDYPGMWEDHCPWRVTELGQKNLQRWQ